MNFEKHYELINKHATLSPSNHAWLNYDLEKFQESYYRSFVQKRGTLLHGLAKQCILLHVNLPKNKKAINQFVNDAIGYRMSPEQILFYSYNAFGTADAISFRNNLLRIHDLKTGTGRVTMEQLEIYAALFCLEYDFLPNTIDMELRIYQTTNVLVHHPEPSVIRRIMEKIKIFDKKIQEIESEEEPLWLT